MFRDPSKTRTALFQSFVRSQRKVVNLKSLSSPDRIRLQAVHGWIELGNFREVDREWLEITPVSADGQNQPGRVE
jgi:hypothetical protein